jgi:tetratricopeptide (TPR) repeat protein
MRDGSDATSHVLHRRNATRIVCRTVACWALLLPSLIGPLMGQSTLKRQADRLYSDAQEMAALGKVEVNSEALSRISESIKLYELANDLKGAAYAVQMQAYVLETMGLYAQASDGYVNAAKRHHAGGHVLAEANSYRSAAQMQGRLGNTATQIDLYQRALEAIQPLEDRGGQAILLDELADTYTRANRLRESVTAYLQEIELRKALRQPESVAIVYVKLANRLMTLEDYKESASAFGEALKIYSERHDSGQQARVYRRLAELSKAVKNFQFAERFYEQSVQAAQQAGDTRMRANSINDLGLMQYETNRVPDAIKSYETACALYQSLGTQSAAELGVCLWNLGLAYEVSNKLGKALEILTQFPRLLLKDTDKPQLARVYERIGTISRKLGRIDAATESLNKAAILYRSVQDVGGATRVEAEAASLPKPR